MALPSLHRVRTASVPLPRWYYGVLRRPASLAPRSVAFAWRYQALRPSFRSLRPRRPAAGQGFVYPVPPAGSCRLETIRTSQVPGEPLCPYAVFFDPGRTGSTRPFRCAGAAPAMSTTKAPTTKNLSRLCSTALRLAVYASSGRLPAQDAKLASGCWPSSAGRD
jgi:hypothetical protein